MDVDGGGNEMQERAIVKNRARSIHTFVGGLEVAKKREKSVLYGITSGTSADKLLRGQLSWLKDRGWNVALAVAPDDRARKAANREGVRLIELPMEREISPKKDLASLIAWNTLLRRERPSVLNISTPKAALLGSVSGWLARIPRRVYVMRGLRLEGATGVLQRLLWLTERLTVLASTDVVVVSKSLGEEAKRARLLKRRRTWLIGDGSSNGVLADNVRAEVEEGLRLGLREQLGFTDQDVVVGYVGRLAPDKGIDTLLAALQATRQESVVGLLIGSDDGVDPQVLSEAGVHIEWTDDVWQYYSAMDVLCLPTRREGFPNVVLEAAAASVPAVTTRATGAIDSVVDGETGLLVDVDDVEGLIHALRQLASDPKSRRAMGDAARRRVDDRFLPEQIWGGLASILANDPAPHVSRI